MTREEAIRAAQFYESYPTGQYDEEAAHALRCHHDLLEALERLLTGYGFVDYIDDEDRAADPDVIAARAAIAKATGA